MCLQEGNSKHLPSSEVHSQRDRGPGGQEWITPGYAALLHSVYCLCPGARGSWLLAGLDVRRVQGGAGVQKEEEERRRATSRAEAFAGAFKRGGKRRGGVHIRRALPVRHLITAANHHSHDLRLALQRQHDSFCGARMPFAATASRYSRCRGHPWRSRTKWLGRNSP
ncbi:unnamed protein product [Lota lota]